MAFEKQYEFYQKNVIYYDQVQLTQRQSKLLIQWYFVFTEMYYCSNLFLYEPINCHTKRFLASTIKYKIMLADSQFIYSY